MVARDGSEVTLVQDLASFEKLPGCREVLEGLWGMPASSGLQNPPSPCLAVLMWHMLQGFWPVGQALLRRPGAKANYNITAQSAIADVGQCRSLEQSTGQ